MALDDRHPGAERLAEYAEGALAADECALVERHLVECADCRAVATETMAFMTQEQGSATPGTASRVIPFRRSRWLTGVAAGLAMAAALVLAIRVARPTWLGLGDGSDRPELRELVAALANEPTRPVEGRLTGGFKYAPPPSPTRGPGEREVSPDVRIAAAEIERRARDLDTPRNRAALGDALLALRDVDRAIESLRRAAAAEPANASFQNDLAVALLAGGRQPERQNDLTDALRAVELAMQLSPRLLEARFNHALILSALGRSADSQTAWEVYRNADRESAWGRESKP